MQRKNLLLDRQEQILEVRINRPKELNALNTETLQELSDVLREETKDVKVVILSGSGDKAFVAGSDVREMEGMNALKFRSYSGVFKETMTLIRTLEKPVIAAVNGVAFGGGNGLALSCDFIIASEDALFGQQEINVGIFGGASLLTSLVGRVRAADVVFTGRALSAKEAKEWGLITKVVSKEALEQEVNKLARHLASRPPIALALAKEAINNASKMPLESANNYEMELMCFCFDTDDQREGMRAFVEGRKPLFQGK